MKLLIGIETKDEIFEQQIEVKLDSPNLFVSTSGIKIEDFDTHCPIHLF